MEKHGRYPGAPGSVCRYALELDGKLNVDDVRQQLDQCQALNWMLSRAIVRHRWLSIPRWTRSKTVQPLSIRTHQSDALIPSVILDRGLDFERGQRIEFDILNRSNGKSTFIVSWHHLLMDGQGAILLLKHINQSIQASNFNPQSTEKIRYTTKLAARTVKLFLYYTGLFWMPYAYKFRSGIQTESKNRQLHQKAKLIEFDHEETKRINLNAENYGAKLGLSPFLLASTSISVLQMLKLKGQSIREFWVPVPQDQRKKGASGPILGNHLSFLFYTMKKKELTDLEQLTNAIQHQMVNQVKKDSPKAYDALMRGFRILPSSLYYRLVKGSRGTSLASFLFTIAADHPKDLQEFLGHKVIRAISLPPNTYPPGVTIAFMKNDGKLQVVLLYYEEIWSEKELLQMEGVLKNMLLGQ